MANLLFRYCLILGACLLLFTPIGVGGCGDITNELASLTISPSSVTVGINKFQAFSVIGTDAAGNLVQVTPTWSVTGGVGTINSGGIFTAAATEGTGSVVATYGSASSNCTVSITTKGWLQGTFLTPDGAYAQGIIVYLLGHSGYEDDTDSKGRYLIEAIPPGTYEAMTRETQTYAAASKEVTIASGETVTWSTSLSLKPNVPTIPTTTIPSF